MTKNLTKVECFHIVLVTKFLPNAIENGTSISGAVCDLVTSLYRKNAAAPVPDNNNTKQALQNK